MTLKLPALIPLAADDFDALPPIIGFPVYNREGDPSQVWPKPSEQFKNMFPEFFGMKLGNEE